VTALPVIPQIPVVLRGCQLHSGMHQGSRETLHWERVATAWLWSRRDKPQRTYCGLNLGKTVAVSTIACVYLVTLSKAKTNNTKYLADSKELSGLCEARSGSGLLKILSLNLSGGLKTFMQSLTPNGLGAVRVSNWAPLGQEWNLSKLNCCNISEQVGDMFTVRMRKECHLTGESGEMVILRVYKDVTILV